MNAKPLSLSAHCLQSWRESLPSAFDAGNRIASLMAVELEAAPKFLLPENGVAFEDLDSIAHMLPDMRLPFPCVALEFHQAGEVAAHQVRSSKRIALVWDLQGDEPEVFRTLTGESLGKRPSFLVQTIAYIDEYQVWMPVMGFVEARLDRPVDHFSRSKQFSYSSQVWCTLPELKEQPGENEVTIAAKLAEDSRDEVSAALSFAALSSCTNVRFETVPAPVQLNKKREANGKVPFQDVRVLMVSDEDIRTAARSAPGAGTHASPYIPLRRGHVHSLDDTKRVWVNAAVGSPGIREAAAARYEMLRDRGG